MSTREQIARSTADALASASLPALRAVMGFDGFVDQIIDVVDKRHAYDRYDRLATIPQFATRVSAAAGKSANFELVVKKRKLGGNGPIMANALAAMGVGVDYIGTVGGSVNDPTACHPVFAEFASRATLTPLAPPANTNALEFTDGKLMLGDLEPLSQVTWERLVEVVGLAKLTALFDKASLLGMLNWTMLPHLTSIWQGAAVHILPKLSKQKRRLFVDLADPEKRNVEDFRFALAVLTKINDTVPVTLGLNLSEAQQTARALCIAGYDEVTENIDSAVLRELAGKIQAKLALDTVVIHPRSGAAAARSEGTAYFAGPFVQNPKISTGAGDHFNAGFATGQLLDLPLEGCLCLGTATSGYYVRNAVSPTAAELAAFLKDLPLPQ